MKYVTGEAAIQGSEAWLALKRTKIGASVSPVLLGISPYSSPAQVWREMMRGETPFVNKAMKHGSATEPEAREYFNNIVHYKSPEHTFKPAVVLSEEYDLLMASLDGINESETVILEIKCPGKNVYDLCMQEKIPKYWESQIQHQLAVTGLDLAILFVYIDPSNNLIVRYMRDEEKIKEIVKVCTDFEKNHLWTQICPESDKIIYEERDDSAFQHCATDWKEAKRMRESWEECENARYKELLALSKGKPCKGFGVRIECTEKKGLVDYSLVEELQDVNLDQYRKPSKIVWRICETRD